MGVVGAVVVEDEELAVAQDLGCVGSSGRRNDACAWSAMREVVGIGSLLPT